MAVDMLSALYRKKMHFFTDDDRGLDVQWFWCQDDAKDFPYPNAFVDGVWETKLQHSVKIGERQVENPTLRVMATPVTATGQGPPCGTPAQWANGFPIGTFSGRKYDPLGIPLCCGNSNLDWGGGMGNSSCIFPTQILAGGGMGNSGATFPGITYSGVLAQINTATPGSNPAAIPPSVPQMVVVYTATVSGSGLGSVLTSALAGVLTPVLTAPGPIGSTFAQSLLAVYEYLWTGAADTLTISGIPGGGVVLAVVAGFPGGIGTNLLAVTAAGGAQPITQPMAATVAGAAYVCGGLYNGIQSPPAWAPPFTQGAPFGVLPVWVNYDATDFALELGYYINPGGAVTAADNPAAGSAWVSIGGVWQ